MPQATFETHTEGQATLEFRAPRQSEVLDVMARSAGITEASEAHRAHLDFVSALCDRDREWLDDQVPFDVLGEIARHLLASRLPSDDALGKSRVSLA